ncbi:MAG: glucose dehydrogenase [Solirubrobacterales bacterium 70-9]|nr:MAG: glucose dehydrogenase [Solirubrobacterales bacterium 70-9]
MGERLEADVVVIGSGPSGSIVTHTLATAGVDVVCLEQGDWINPSDFGTNEPEWELSIQQRWAHDPNVRMAPADYPVEVSDSDMWPVMLNAVGGTSLFYGAEWVRLMASDFRLRSSEGICDDWPISYAELKPFHDEVDAFLGVAGVGGDPAYPEGLDYPMPPHPIGKVGMKAAEGVNKLGWHWWPGVNAIAVNRHKTLERCLRHGVCEWGCPAGAKASFDLIYLPQAIAAGARLLTGARVSRIESGPDGLATGAHFVDREGEENFVAAKAVVVCANGIGTPRLLLLSDGPAHPDGLANSSGLVGKNLMLHPNCTVTGYYDEDLESWKGPVGESIHSMEFYETRPEHDFVRGGKMNVLPTPGPLAAVEAHRDQPFDQVWGPAFADVAARHRSGILWATNTEDLPEETNRVTLDPTLTDGDGVPAPKVSYRISDNTRRILDFHVERMTELHEASGASEMIAVDVWLDQPGHLLGTARMGDDPERSVVDSYGRAHDVPNLFVADGSIFVTGGAANPTSTITALALRIAKHIVATAAERPTAGGVAR